MESVQLQEQVMVKDLLPPRPVRTMYGIVFLHKPSLLIYSKAISKSDPDDISVLKYRIILQSENNKIRTIDRVRANDCSARYDERIVRYDHFEWVIVQHQLNSLMPTNDYTIYINFSLKNNAAEIVKKAIELLKRGGHA